MALGKDGRAYLLNRANLGGIAAPLASATVSGGAIINSAAAYTTSAGTFVVFRGGGSGCPAGQSGGLTAIKVTAGSPPSLAVAWCGGPSTVVSPIVTMSNAQGADAVVWTVGNDGKLHGVNANTGQSVFAGGSSTDVVATVQGFQTPIVANGRLFVASENQIYAFTP
jgi:outer membrane protein assembly factor BamB